MIGAATTLIALLLTAEFGSETVEVGDRGTVDLASFECRDTPRSTLIQRACYDPAQASMIVSVKGTYHQYCDLPPATVRRPDGRAVDGAVFKQNFGGAGRDRRYGCGMRRARGP